MIRCYINFLNARRTLFETQGVNIFSLELHNLIEELAEDVGEECTPIHRVFTGIHRKRVNLTATTM